ncbi:Cullin binding [Novymonas esmeraldas]|uniref:Defective in cullin neddylation protein n=1 Tax=Novymonas esmeraldas TaxID=1808958 RepID=A0AAW0EIW0_9TRYP
MSFLRLPRRNEQQLRNAAQEAFDYLYAQIPTTAAVEGERFLELGHFEALAAATHLRLDDLSIYLLAFAVDESAKSIYKISEKHFVAWLGGLTPALSHTAAPPCKENGYASLFAAAHDAVVALNNTIRTSEERRNKFYQFLYNWCLKGNTSSDRVDSAKELWSCFFSRLPVSHTPSEGQQRFSAYVFFPRIGQWLDFIEARNDAAAVGKSGKLGIEQSGVSFDTWAQLVPFAQFTNYDAYNDEDSWPVTMDDFVAYVQKTSKGKTT